ncbi:MAG TPA: secondary thiamine-phosphate synthase enzyme YjbQ [Vicinamibacteria bacterium]|nr:secondary thiamine-phosphate synthase enzyme YjbQ [Vicinamibacteria bacterium]
MAVQAVRCSVTTRGNGEVLDVTGEVAEAVRGSGIANGIATVFVTGSTAALTTLEFEPGLVHDLNAAFERLYPREMEYRHHERWGDDNGHSHVRASMLGPSLVVPVSGGELALGRWQQIVLVDFDTRPRAREFLVQVMGD